MGRIPKSPFIPTPQVAAATTAQLRRIVHRDDPTLRCRVLPPDAFFASRTAQHARHLCAGCRIRVECAELAVREESHGTYFDGVRGGLSPPERRAVVRRRKEQDGKNAGAAAPAS